MTCGQTWNISSWLDPSKSLAHGHTPTKAAKYSFSFKPPGTWCSSVRQNPLGHILPPKLHCSASTSITSHPHRTETWQPHRHGCGPTVPGQLLASHQHQWHSRVADADSDFTINKFRRDLSALKEKWSGSQTPMHKCGWQRAGQLPYTHLETWCTATSCLQTTPSVFQMDEAEL